MPGYAADVPDLERLHVTARLTIEPLVAAHADELFPLLTPAELHRFTPRRPPASRDALRERYQRLSSRRSPDGAERWLNWVMRSRDDGRAVGLLEATVTDEHAFVAYTVVVDAQRRGFGREGLTWLLGWLASELRVTRCVATVDVANAASIALARSVGMVLVETRPADEPEGGDEHLFEICP